MGVLERKSRDRAARERRITGAAREIARRDGWGAVTIRRLADEIEYSQPVLYSHFENRDAIVAAVAVDGFRELTAAIEAAASLSSDRQAGLRAVGIAYLDFARSNPSLYEAMFTMPTALRFADADTLPELRAAFAVLAAVVTPSGHDEVATETFWASLHGLAELERSGRIRPGVSDDRVAFVVRGLASGE